MSVLHPIIAVTGSSGAGTTTVKKAFEDIFRRLKVTAAIVEGDSFHRYDRKQMKEAVIAAEKEGKNISHFGPESNIFDKLEDLFRQYSRSGKGMVRKYLHNDSQEEHMGTEVPMVLHAVVLAEMCRYSLILRRWSPASLSTISTSSAEKV